MSDAPPTEVNPGLPLFADRYRIERSLGRGGMGEVDYAYDTVLRRPVAIKRLLMGATDPSAERRASRLLREARAVALLNHPNVVSVHDVGDAAGVPFVVMELAEGGSLRAQLGRQGRPPMALALAWLSDKGISMILVEQNAHMALDYSHRAYVLETGRVVMEGASAKVKCDPAVIDAYLGFEVLE